MITLTITKGPSFQVEWKRGMNAQKVMEAAFNNQGSPRTFTYMLQYYGTALGYLVDMIDGTFERLKRRTFIGILKLTARMQKRGLIIPESEMGKP